MKNIIFERNTVVKHVCLCGKSNFKELKYPKFDNGKKLYVCRNCTLTHFFPFPVEDNFDATIYQDVDYIEKIEEEEHWGYFKTILDYIENNSLATAKSRILDFGSGRSFYHQFFIKSGFLNISSYDVNVNLIKQARRLYGVENMYSNVKDMPDNKFNLILANMVFEHIFDPLELLNKEIYNLLEPNGHVMITVPNGSSLNRKLLGKMWIGYSPDEHIWFFNKNAVRKLFLNSEKYELISVVSESSVNKKHDIFEPSGLFKKIYYNSFMRLFEFLGYGDQLILSLRKK